MRFGSTAKVLAECKLKYYRISECAAGMAKETALQYVDACLACEHLRLQAAATRKLADCLSALLPTPPPQADSPTNHFNPLMSPPTGPLNGRHSIGTEHPSGSTPDGLSGRSHTAGLQCQNAHASPGTYSDPSGSALPAGLQQPQGCDASHGGKEAGDLLEKAQYLPLFCRIAGHCLLLAEAAGEPEGVLQASGSVSNPPDGCLASARVGGRQGPSAQDPQLRAPPQIKAIGEPPEPIAVRCRDAVHTLAQPLLIWHIQVRRSALVAMGPLCSTCQKAALGTSSACAPHALPRFMSCFALLQMPAKHSRTA